MSVHHGEGRNRDCGAYGAHDPVSVLDRSESRALVSQELVPRELVSEELVSKLARRPRAKAWVAPAVLLLIAMAVVVLLVASHNEHIADCQVETTSGGTVICSLNSTDFVGGVGFANVDLAAPDSRIANSGVGTPSQFSAPSQPGTFQGHGVPSYDGASYDGARGQSSKGTQATDDAISIRPSLILDTGTAGISRSNVSLGAREIDGVMSSDPPEPTSPPDNDPPGVIVIPWPPDGRPDPSGGFWPPPYDDMMVSLDTRISKTESGKDDLIFKTRHSIGSGKDGISATEENAGDLVIDAEHMIEADEDGIDARESGTGELRITATEDIVAETGHGITAAEAGDGDLTITASGDITTSANGKHGITARQDGAGKIVVTSSGNLRATGKGSDGIRTENADAGGETIVNLTGGSVRGGEGAGAGVNFSRSTAGAVNTLNSSAHVSAASGIAVRGGAGHDIVNNENGGVLSGTIDLAGRGDGDDALNNRFGGRLEAGEVINLGTHGALENAGALAPASDDTVGTTALTGHLIQTATGRYDVDIASVSRASDRIDVAGTANLSGHVSVTLDKLMVGQQDFTIVTASGGVVRNGLAIDRIVTRSGLEISLNSQVVDVQLTYPNAKDVVLSMSVDFARRMDGSLNQNQTAIGNVLNIAFADANGPLQPLLTGLINGPANIAAYRDALSVLQPEVYLNTEAAMLFSADDFMKDLFACPTADRGATPNRGSQCVWVRPKGRKFKRESTSASIGFEDTVGGVSAGMQFGFATGWFANIAAGYENGSLSTDSGAESDSDRFHVGGAVLYEVGPWQFSGAFTGGIGMFDTARRVAFAGFNAGTAVSDYDIRYIGGQLRAAYHVSMPGWYLRPVLDVSAVYLDRDGVNESGAGAANLVVGDSEDTVFSASPALELGGQYELVPGTMLKPFLMLGVTVYSDDDRSAVSAFAGEPNLTFETATEHGNLFANISAGAELGSTSGLGMTIGYDGVLSDDVTQHSVYAKGRLSF
ncbi:MAG: autotransporter domain-containing protein [Pseudomonadota bacterium]